MRIASESLCSGTVLLPAMLPGRGYSLPMLLRMRASPLRVSGVVPMAGFEFRFVHRQPCLGVHRQRVEHGVEGRVGVHRGFLVVGATTLAAVAAEDPAVEADSFGGLFLDRVAGDTASRVDYLRGDDSAVGQLSMQLWQRPQRDPSKGGS